mgnify:CR=1 FL=1
MNDLLTFIAESPSRFHAVENLGRELQAAGYTRLAESQTWLLTPGGKGGEVFVDLLGQGLQGVVIVTDVIDMVVGINVPASCGGGKGGGRTLRGFAVARCHLPGYWSRPADEPSGPAAGFAGSFRHCLRRAGLRHEGHPPPRRKNFSTPP